MRCRGSAGSRPPSTSPRSTASTATSSRAPGCRPVESEPEVLAAYYAANDDLPGAGALERTTALCLATYTGDQLLRDIDAMAMAQSLEVRVPFLDPVLADVALSLPDAAK